MKPKTAIRIIITVVVILYLFAMWIAFYGSSRSISLLLYYFNWRHWPWWYALNLWLIILGGVLILCFQNQRLSCLIRLAILLVVSTITFVYSTWIHTLLYLIRNTVHSLYQTVIIRSFYAPVTDLFTDGTVSGRLFITPSVALIFIVSLLIWNQRMKKRSKIDNKKQGKES